MKHGYRCSISSISSILCLQTYIFFIHFGRLGVGAFHFGFSVPTAVCGYVLADCIPPLCLSGPSPTSGRLVIPSLAIFNEMVKYYDKAINLSSSICFTTTRFYTRQHKNKTSN